MKCGKLCFLLLFFIVSTVIAGIYIGKVFLNPSMENPVEVVKADASTTYAPPPPTTPGDPNRFLIVEGKKGSGCEKSVTLSEQQLRSLPQQTFKTSHTWTNAPEELSGPLLADVLQLACPKPKKIYIRALNEYSVSVAFDKVKKYEPILVMSANGKPLSIRDKGPLWVMINFDRFKEIPERSLDEMLVWQLYYISILTSE